MPKANKPTSKVPTPKFSKLKITPLNLVKSGGIKMCVYGLSGSGKTRFAGTIAEKNGPLLHIVCSGQGLGETISIKGIDNVFCTELEEVDQLPLLKQYAIENGFKTIVLDHVTEFSDRVLANILGLSKMPEQSSWGLAKIQQYAQQGLQVKTYLRDLLDFEGNVILIGQERAYQAEGGIDNALMPFVSCASSPTIAGWIGPACDYIVHMFKRKKFDYKKVVKNGKTINTKIETDATEFCMRIGPHEVYTTKWRCPYGTELPDVIVDPSYSKIEELF